MDLHATEKPINPHHSGRKDNTAPLCWCCSLFYMFHAYLCLCVHVCLSACFCVCLYVHLSVSTSKERPSSHSYYCCEPLHLPSLCLTVPQWWCWRRGGEGRGSALSSWTGRRGEGVRRSKRRGGGDVSLGRLLGAGRGAPIIVAGDRSETSPSNPSGSARKSCHRGSSAAPRASHLVCQHPGWKTETRGLSRPKGQQDQSWG